jgi:hypothetical protein
MYEHASVEAPSEIETSRDVIRDIRKKPIPLPLIKNVKPTQL